MVKTKKNKRGGNKKNKRGGGSLAPVPFLPPNKPVDVPVPGITSLHPQQYYYAHNDRVVPNPLSTNKALVMKRGGRKSRRKRRKSKHKKRVHKKRSRKMKKRSRKVKRRSRKAKRRSRKVKRRNKQRGGAGIIESIPGGTDLRDVYYRAGNMIGSLYSQYNGYGPTNQPPMSSYVDQPILNDKAQGGSDVPLHTYIQDGSAQAAKPEFSANYS